MALILLFGNKMLLTSWLSSSLLASIWIVHGKEIMESALRLIGKEKTKEEKKEEPESQEKQVQICLRYVENSLTITKQLLRSFSNNFNQV